MAKGKPSNHHIALAAVALYMDDAHRLAAEHGLSSEMVGWHSSHETPADFKLKWRDQSYNLEVLVHDGGYKGQAAALRQMYALGMYPGLQGLCGSGMAESPRFMQQCGPVHYPRMLQWLRGEQ